MANLPWQIYHGKSTMANLPGKPMLLEEIYHCKSMKSTMANLPGKSIKSTMANLPGKPMLLEEIYHGKSMLHA